MSRTHPAMQEEKKNHYLLVLYRLAMLFLLYSLSHFGSHVIGFDTFHRNYIAFATERQFVGTTSRKSEELVRTGCLLDGQTCLTCIWYLETLKKLVFVCLDSFLLTSGLPSAKSLRWRFQQIHVCF